MHTETVRIADDSITGVLAYVRPSKRLLVSAMDTKVPMAIPP
ncbi:MAG TPA: hypothetical protein VLH38_04955 [Patescibacteria group bacterium]|nr:hypothetical protein [Patescibacteria group bacterium]